MRKLILLIALLAAVPAVAQERPIAGTTVQTTDTTANSVLVGCAVGSTTCTGGVKAGPVVATSGTFTGALVGTQLTVNSVGIIATDGRIPAISSTYFASLAGTNLTGVALLASVNTFTALGSHTWAASGAGANSLAVGNGTAGTTNQGILQASSNLYVAQLAATSSTFTATGAKPQGGAYLTTDGVGGLSISATDAAGVIRFYTGGTTLRWGINAAGDHTFGTSSNIADSSGTPSFAGAGFGTSPTISGTDYAFRILAGTGTFAGGTINFGHTFASAPACVASHNTVGAGGSFITSSTTTNVSITISTGNLAASETIYVLCRGF